MPPRRDGLKWPLRLCFVAATLVSGHPVPQSSGLNSPPVLVINPRRWQIPIDDPVGSRIAKFRVSDNEEGAQNVTVELDDSQAALQGFQFKSGKDYFRIVRRQSAGSGEITLSRSLADAFQPGDHLALSVVAHDGTITTRTEVFVTVEEPFHGDAPPIYPNSTTTSTTTTPKPKRTRRPLPPSSSSEEGGDGSEKLDGGARGGSRTGSGSSKNRNKNHMNISSSSSEEAEEAKRKEAEIAQNSSRTVILILVPLFVLVPLGSAICWFARHKIRSACSKAKETLSEIGRGDAGDKELKIESASGEFTHELTRTNLGGGDGNGAGDAAGGGGGARKMSRLSALSAASSSNAVAHQHFYSPGQGDDAIKEEGEDSDEWEFPRHHLKMVSLMGKGCFGQVWKAEATEGIPGLDKKSVTVAVKMLRTEGAESATEKEKRDLKRDLKQDFLHELSMMKMLDPNPNVVRLLGCCTEKDPIFIILEFVDGSTLQEFLRNSRSEHNYKNLHGESQTLTARDLTSFAFQIAKGMAYLSSKKIIHRDLAARNVLIDDSTNVCKVADFGFARHVMGNNIYERKSQGKLPIRWMAPESLYDNCYTTKSDVWSFGVLMWEIVALGSTPYPGKSPSEVMEFVRDGGRLEKPPHCDRRLYNIMSYCWSKSPEDRPDFASLVEDFQQLLVQDTDYIDLNMFPEHAYYNEVSRSDEKV